MLASTRVMENVLIQATTASEGQLYFILGWPCKNKHLSLRYREAYIKGSG
jgi:hypothetical protein